MMRPEPKKDLSSLKKALEENQVWPTRYTFKFIVKGPALPHLLALLDGFEISTRESKKGTYTSVTAVQRMMTAGDVIAVYERVSEVEGIMSF